jgi:hypothetical protein
MEKRRNPNGVPNAKEDLVDCSIEAHLSVVQLLTHARPFRNRCPLYIGSSAAYQRLVLAVARILQIA